MGEYSALVAAGVLDFAAHRSGRDGGLGIRGHECGGGEGKKECGRDGLEAFERPERGEAAVGGGGVIGDDLGEVGGDGGGRWHG